MTYQQAETLLSGFPKLFNATVIRRSNILHGSSGPSLTGTRRTGHSNPTATKAAALADLSGTIKLITVVRKWIDTQLALRDRSLLIFIWRAEPWSQIARKHRQEVSKCKIRWQQMILNLKAYVGTANGRDGNAYATGRQSRQRVL